MKDRVISTLHSISRIDGIGVGDACFSLSKENEGKLLKREK